MLGAASFFQQTGGTNTAAYVNLGGGCYVLSGGLLELSAGLQLAGGTLNCGGGAATIQAGSGTIVDLSSGSVVNTASTSLSLGADSLLIVSQGFNPATAFLNYSNLGATEILGTTFRVRPARASAGPARSRTR